MIAEHVNEIIKLISEGMSLRKAAEKVGSSPQSFLRVTAKDSVYAEQYARAREERGLALAEQALEVSDDPEIDPAHKRIMVDTRKWFASKLNPKNLGDKIDLNHGGQAANPVTVVNLLARSPESEEK